MKINKFMFFCNPEEFREADFEKLMCHNRFVEKIAYVLYPAVLGRRPYCYVYIETYLSSVKISRIFEVSKNDIDCVPNNISFDDILFIISSHRAYDVTVLKQEKN